MLALLNLSCNMSDIRNILMKTKTGEIKMSQASQKIVILPVDNSHLKVSVKKEIKECQDAIDLLHSIDEKECIKGHKMKGISDIIMEIYMREQRLKEYSRSLN